MYLIAEIINICIHHDVVRLPLPVTSFGWWFLFVGFRGINMRIAKCIHSTAAQFAGHLISMILRKNFLLKNDFHFNRLVTN